VTQQRFDELTTPHFFEVEKAMTHLWFNLHRRDWTVKDGRAPVRHLPSACLVSVTFTVREAARLRVVARRCREVHAWAAGELSDGGEVPPGAVEVSYNPYRGPTFYRKDTGDPVVGAARVYFQPDGRAWAVEPF
jgi:hypothetical protein